eukprot:19071-Heterococcus_DN1.PRE.1
MQMRKINVSQLIKSVKQFIKRHLQQTHKCKRCDHIRNHMSDTHYCIQSTTAYNSASTEYALHK